jgi:hypothetical protein
LRGPEKKSATTDLALGLAAAGAFLAMVFLLQMHVLLAAPLAGGVYLGLRLLTAGPTASPALPSEAELIQAIGQHAHAVREPRVQRQLAEICRQAQLFLAYLQQHPQEAGAWRGVVRECLDSTLGIVQRYVELSRFVDDPGSPALREVEALLAQAAATFAGLRRRLVEEGAADLSAEVAAFRSTLQAVDEVSLSNRRGGTE